jgi:hypothetical protein
MAAKPSPFPGMDPWIEPVWRPFHNDYVGFLRRQLAAQLPDDLYAQTEADVFVIDRGTRRSAYHPDVATFDRGGDPTPTATAGQPLVATSVVDTPIVARVRRRPEIVRHIAVREPRQGHRLVTAVELFSPTNKGDPRERAAYRDKRDAYLRASANVVEVDLRRGGENLMDLEPADLPAEDTTAYRVCVRFANPDIGDRAEYYPIPLRSRLPRVAVPLRSGDADVTLDLQQAFADVYAVGRYDLQLDYARPPAPPLSPADAAWAAERIAAAGRGPV